MAASEVCNHEGHVWFLKQHESNRRGKIVTTITKINTDQIDNYNPRNLFCVRCHRPFKIDQPAEATPRRTNYRQLFASNRLPGGNR